MRRGNICRFRLMFALILPLSLAACSDHNTTDTQAAEWPIAKEVFTTAQQQILPIGLSEYTPQINPKDVPLYASFGYSAWHAGTGLPHVKRTELAPGYTGAPNAARLFSFFTMSDIHITDKESPAQAINPGWSAVFGPSSAGLFVSSYSPIILSTTHVLDAAVQTINALHEKSPFDFGVSLGDDINNNQYNELRWFIDVLDGKVITPSSGAHAGADTIDYQKPYKAVGLDRTIPWYQVIGNHDQELVGRCLRERKNAAGPCREHHHQPEVQSRGPGFHKYNRSLHGSGRRLDSLRERHRSGTGGKLSHTPNGHRRREPTCPRDG